MTLNEYQNATARTFPDLGSKKLNIAHMVMGIVSEENELINAYEKGDIINVGEELSDKEWYLSNYCRIHHIFYKDLKLSNTPYLFVGSLEDHMNYLFFLISQLTDIEKKFIAYNKEVNKEIRFDYCCKIFKCIDHIYEFFNLDGQKCRENNINKLKVRFPDKFSEENAINRDLIAERAELEK